MQFVSGIQIYDMPCSCGNTNFHGDYWPNCKCGKRLSDEVLAVIKKEYAKWWKEVFDFPIDALKDCDLDE